MMTEYYVVSPFYSSFCFVILGLIIIRRESLGKAICDTSLGLLL